jgi:hypothetical protein
MRRKPRHQPIELQTELFEKRHADFKKLDNQIFSKFIIRQDGKCKDKGIWVRGEYENLVKTQRSEWESEEQERMWVFLKTGELTDPDAMPAGTAWSFASMIKAVRKNIQSRKEDDPEGYAEDEERRAYQAKEGEQRQIEQKKLLEQNPSLVSRMETRHREWLQKTQQEPQKVNKEVLPRVDDDDLIEALKRMEIQDNDESSSSEEQNQMPDELELEKPLKLKHWKAGIVALGTDYQDSSEEAERIPAEIIARPEPRTREHWELFFARAEKQKYEEIAENSDSEERLKTVRIHNTTSHADKLRSWRDDAKVLEPKTYAARLEKDAARKNIERWGTADENEIKRIKDEQSLIKKEARRLSKVAYKKAMREQQKAVKTGNVSTAVPEDQSSEEEY